ncbi:MAG: DNA transformation protein [Pirellulaceae bacterium]|jgi:DNA transformation protein
MIHVRADLARNSNDVVCEASVINVCEISVLLNLGPKSAESLAEIGIKRRAQLEDLGPVAVFRMLRQAGQRPSLNMLYALEGVLAGVHWNQILPQRKQYLRREVDADD